MTFGHNHTSRDISKGRYCGAMTAGIESIKRIDVGDEQLLVWLQDSMEPLQLPWFWVRDHSRDPDSFDAATQQRTIDSFTIDPTIRPAKCEIAEDEIRIDWDGDTARSVLPASLLRELRPKAPHRGLWPAPSDLTTTVLGYDDVVTSDDALGQWLRSIDRFGFGLISGTPSDIGAAEELVNRIGYVRRTIFGDVWTLSSAEVDHADSAYSTTYLEPHTDGTYSHDGPGMQLFSCVERTGTGGDSVLVDGFAAAEDLRTTEPDKFEWLTTVDVPAHYIENGVELRASRPTIRLSSSGAVEQISFNNYDRSPFLLPGDRYQQWFEAYRALHDLITDETRWWTHRLEPGDTLLFDNWRCLHGRLAYTGRRKFHGCYLNHEDLESRLRVIDAVR